MINLIETDKYQCKNCFYWAQDKDFQYDTSLDGHQEKEVTLGYCHRSPPDLIVSPGW